MSIDGLSQVEINVALDCVSSEVEGFIQLDEGWGHSWVRRKDIMINNWRRSVVNIKSVVLLNKVENQYQNFHSFLKNLFFYKEFADLWEGR